MFYFLLMSIQTNKSYQFYKLYHQNKVNKLIHIICIPLIVWSLSVLLNSIVFNFGITLFNVQTNFNISFSLNIYLSFIILFFYWIFYMLIDYQSYQQMFLFLSFIWLSSYYFFISFDSPYYYAIIVNVFSWIMQFIGHGIFEGKRPALMDSIHQAFLMAPLFTYYELLELFKN